MECTESPDIGEQDRKDENQDEQTDGCGLWKLLKGKQNKKSESDDEEQMLNNKVEKSVNAVENDPVTPHFVVLKKLDSIPSGYLVDTKYVYNMDHVRRGKMTIVSNRYFLESSGLEDCPRHGTEFDAENLRTTFIGLGFECEIHEDKTCSQMLQLVINASESSDSDCDCMAFAFLSHGDDDGLIYGIDQAMSIDNLLSPLKHSYNMHRFAGKPKLVFIQACRGVEFDAGVDVFDGPIGNPAPMIVACEADFLYSYSTAPGYYSFRGKRGSVYIRTLCSMIRKYQSSLDLVTILTRLCHKVAFSFESNVDRRNPDYVILSNRKQMPSTVSSLTKDLYFVPKQRVVSTVDYLDSNTV